MLFGVIVYSYFGQTEVVYIFLIYSIYIYKYLAPGDPEIVYYTNHLPRLDSTAVISSCFWIIFWSSGIQN